MLRETDSSFSSSGMSPAVFGSLDAALDSAYIFAAGVKDRSSKCELIAQRIEASINSRNGPNLKMRPNNQGEDDILRSEVSDHIINSSLNDFIWWFFCSMGI
jgi:hypothetical protein